MSYEMKELLVFIGQTHIMSGNKRKLTVTVDSKLIELAKSAEINLSATFENLLRLFIEGRR